jgi:hydroxylamine dehydrogenase
MKLPMRIAALAAATALPLSALGAAKPNPTPALSAQSAACVQCHGSLQPGIVEQWRGSLHAEMKVGCYECHRAGKGEPDAFEHNGQLIATVVTPRDCARCHAHEADEF